MFRLTGYLEWTYTIMASGPDRFLIFTVAAIVSLITLAEKVLMDSTGCLVDVSVM